MISLTGSARIFFCKEAIDLRKGFEGLSAIVEKLFSAELTSGAYFVFLNLRANRMKVLYWDSDGLVIWYKRLEKGSFSKKDLEQGMIGRREFLMMLEGIIPRRFRKRYQITEN